MKLYLNNGKSYYSFFTGELTKEIRICKALNDFEELKKSLLTLADVEEKTLEIINEDYNLWK